MRSMQRDHVRGMWDSDWLPNISGKQAIYNGLAQYHQSRMCNASKAVGEEIARSADLLVISRRNIYQL